MGQYLSSIHWSKSAEIFAKSTLSKSVICVSPAMIALVLWLLGICIPGTLGNCHGFDRVHVCQNPCDAPSNVEVILVTGGIVDFSCVPPSVQRLQFTGYVDCRGIQPPHIIIEGRCGAELDLRHTLDAEIKDIEMEASKIVTETVEPVETVSLVTEQKPVITSTLVTESLKLTQAFSSTTTEESFHEESSYSEEARSGKSVDQDPAVFKLDELWPFLEKKETRVTSRARTTTVSTTSRPSGHQQEPDLITFSYGDLKEIILILIAGGLVILAVVLTLLMNRPNSVARRLGRLLSTRLWGHNNPTGADEVPMRSLERRPRQPAAQGTNQTTQTSMMATRTTSRGVGGSVHWGPMDIDEPTDLFGPSTGPNSTSVQTKPVPQPRKKVAAPVVMQEEPEYAVPRAPPLPVNSNRPLKEKESGSSEDSSPEGFGRRTSRFTRRAMTWLAPSEISQHPFETSTEDGGKEGGHKKSSATPLKTKDWRPKQLKLPRREDIQEEWSDVELLEKEEKNDKKKKRKDEEKDPDYEN